MRRFSTEQKKLLADFFGNLGVAWFAAGVIGVFLGGAKNLIEIIISISWGLSFSLIFLYAGMGFLQEEG